MIQQIIDQLRNVGVRFGLVILRLTILLPYPVLLKLGTLLGTAGYWLMPRRRLIAQVNINLCFPELNTAQKNKLVKSTFHSLGIAIFETALSWWGKQDKLSRLCHIEGLENLRIAAEKNKGVLLLSAHFTSLEIGGRLLALHHPFAVMYKQHRNAAMESMIKTSRENHYQLAIKHDDIRTMIKSLKQKLVCWYAPDQDLGMHRSVFAPFFNISTATITAPARFAKLSAASVIPFFAIRRSDGKGYDLKILPALVNFPSGDNEADAACVNKVIEQQVRQTPGQYLWMHRRFKTRPPGEASFYSD